MWPAAHPVHPTIADPSLSDPGFNCWQENGDVMMPVVGGRLPGRCVVCAEPSAYRYTHLCRWHPTWLYWTMPLGCIVYAILALAMQETAQIEVPLCDRHKGKRTLGITFAVLGVLFLVFGPAIAAGLNSGVGAAITAILAVGFIVLGGVFARTVATKRIEQGYILLRANPSFVAHLPSSAAPAPLQPPQAWNLPPQQWNPLPPPR